MHTDNLHAFMAQWADDCDDASALAKAACDAYALYDADGRIPTAIFALARRYCDVPCDALETVPLPMCDEAQVNAWAIFQAGKA